MVSAVISINFPDPQAAFAIVDLLETVSGVEDPLAESRWILRASFSHSSALYSGLDVRYPPWPVFRASPTHLRYGLVKTSLRGTVEQLKAPIWSWLSMNHLICSFAHARTS
jgi:hypothetical protein